MPSALLTLVCLVAFVWFVGRQVRSLLSVRSWDDLVGFFDKRNSNLQSGLAISEVGTSAKVRESYDTTHHRTTAGVRLLTTVITPVAAFYGNSLVLEAQGDAIPADLAPWVGLAIFAVGIWYLIYIWTYSIEVSRDTIRVPGVLFVRRSYRLDELERIRLTSGYYANLRFRGGRRVQLLKYVVGRDALLQRLERQVQLTNEDACPSSQKSKLFGAVSFR